MGFVVNIAAGFMANMGLDFVVSNQIHNFEESKELGFMIGSSFGVSKELGFEVYGLG